MDKVDNYDLVYKFIVKFKRDHDGVAPTIQEICDELRWASKNTGAHALDILEERGLIRLGNGARMIEVIGGSWDVKEI